MSASEKIRTLSAWIDNSYPEDMIGTELHAWSGENPRKGITHTRDDVLDELLDVAITALGAYSALTRHEGDVLYALDLKLDFVLDRAGLVPEPIVDAELFREAGDSERSTT